MVTMVRMNRLLICWTGSRKTRGQDAQNWAAPKRFPLIKQMCPHPLALKLSHPGIEQLSRVEEAKRKKRTIERSKESQTARRARATPSRLPSSPRTEKWTYGWNFCSGSFLLLLVSHLQIK